MIISFIKNIVKMSYIMRHRACAIEAMSMMHIKMTEGGGDDIAMGWLLKWPNTQHSGQMGQNIQNRKKHRNTTSQAN